MMTLVVLFTLFLSINLDMYDQAIDLSNFKFDYTQELPVFPGGPDKIWCFLESKFNYKILNADQKPVEYLIDFYIDSSGIARRFKFIDTRPSNIKNEHIDSLKRNEIIRVLTLLPKWELPRDLDKSLKYWYAISIKTPYIEFRCKQKNKNNSH